MTLKCINSGVPVFFKEQLHEDFLWKTVIQNYLNTGGMISNKSVTDWLPSREISKSHIVNRISKGTMNISSLSQPQPYCAMFGILLHMALTLDCFKDWSGIPYLSLLSFSVYTAKECGLSPS